MKNAQNEFGKSAEKSLSATTTTITTTTATADEQQSSALLPITTAGQSGETPIRFSAEIAENVHNNNATAASAAAAAAVAPTYATHAAKMTDELEKHENNNDHGSTSTSNSININNNNNNGSSIIAEAAKILLKNGLNGTSAAAAALLAAQSFQLPPFPLVSVPKSSPDTALRGTTTDSLLEPPPAHVASTSKMSAATVSTAITGPGIHSPQRNNGLPSTSHFKAHSKETYTGVKTSSSSANLARKSLATSDTGVIDCSLGNAANGVQSKATTMMGIGSGLGLGGYSPAGGRLQFFKDGKFILELARAKDGERGGWVSVPRKQFRTPSATSSTVTPASTANACIYPKIESSTSFSFSDDNSSIQSSPWQRDHCWKQSNPKRNISKEMALYYQLPLGVKLTNAGLRFAKMKRRRPFHKTKIDIKHVEMFEKRSSEQQQTLEMLELSNGKSATPCGAATTDEEEDRGSTSSVATLIADNDHDNDNEERGIKMEKIECNETTTTLQNTVKSTLESSEKKTTGTEEKKPETVVKLEPMESGDSKMDDTTCSSENEKMNTSEDGEISTETECNYKKSKNVAQQSDENKEQPSPKQQQPTSTPTPVKSKTGVEYKRLIKKKIKRAKLTTIVQKLIDQMPTRVANLMKTPSTLNSSAGSQQHQTISNFLSNKVSPTSSSSTSPSLNSSSTSACSAVVGTASHRLVEYHQQHVSPRKRILREFEKVSLDDNAAATTSGAGGKRSRAKSNANAAMSAAYRNARSPNNRVHSSVCNVPTAASLSMTTTSAATTTTTTNGESTSKPNKHAAASSAAAAPTRLYSSYSIHSLLGDNANSKKTSDYATNAFQPPQTDHLFHIQKSVSPKSPDAGGGKSPSNTAHKKRSPPYASPLREAHSRSPTVVASDCSPRATPPTFKQRYDAPGFPEHAHSLSSGAHNFHHQQRQGAFYSPYMMASSKYVPGVSSAPLTAGAASPPSTSRSPRHSITAFSTSCAPTSTTAAAAATANTTPTHYIPNAHRTMSQHREAASPPAGNHRTQVESPRDTTPRTVPKKTASIRRQFASPTSSSSSSHSQNTTSANSNNCPSPSEQRNSSVGIEDGSFMDSKSSSAAAAAAAAAAYQQLFQRQSTSAAAAAAGATPLSSPIHPAAYYMYPPAAPLSFSSNGANSAPGATSSAHTASTSPYIPGLMPPSYYHSYISALNITKHYYMGAGASPQSAAAAAAARLSPPFHHLGIPYNGIAMAAAAAAAFTGQPPAHLTHHSMFPPSAASLYGVGVHGGLTSSAPASAAAASMSTTQKTSESNLGVFNEASLLSNSNSSGGSICATNFPLRPASATAQHSHIIKDEQSSDVPLNLSKH